MFDDTETTDFKTFQIKYADMKYQSSAVTEAQTYNLYWFKTFGSVTELESYLASWSDETGLTYEAN